MKGAHRTFESQVVPLHDEEACVIGALAVTRDITARNAAEAALLPANESLEQFAYAAAHDLSGAHPQRRSVSRSCWRRSIAASSTRARTSSSASRWRARGACKLWFEDLLAYTRSLDKPCDEQLTTDANEVVAEALANLPTAIEASGAEVECGDLPSLPIYRVHLLQLLQNLLGNALKYMSEVPPRIEISAVERPHEFTIAVRDNGIGIAADQRERIFGVVKRLHGRGVPGNGIGLAICHRIIANYSGRILLVWFSFSVQPPSPSPVAGRWISSMSEIPVR